MLETHYTLSDEEFEAQFADCSMNPEWFTHEAHIRLAWIHVKKYGVDKACILNSEQIKAFDKKYDEGRRFHKTVTYASVITIHYYMEASKSDTFQGFIKEFPQLISNFKAEISMHYSIDIFDSDLAKREFIEPDLISFGPI